ncbi:UDP-glycosyltransferase UGT5-like [Drosophila nasuta]|uniref:UDP-glycosyltransferase UGT5-like n=1 Tax=Drosophila nasuta TaxID=42062 RepID=UPI00295E5830|nr:UDP-glycosyltransferase UGT5-like [Drosophila nasuta]
MVNMMKQGRSLISCSAVGVLLVALMATLHAPTVNGANILGVFTSHSPSHLIIHMSVMKALAEEGHNVTVVSSMPAKVTHKSIKHILIPLSESEEKTLNDGMAVMAKEKPSMFTTLKTMFGSLSMLINKQVDVLEDERFTELYKNKGNKFDAVFVGFFFNMYQVGLGAKFNCPLIVSWSGPPMEQVDNVIGNPILTSSVPTMNVAVTPGQPMNFKQRLTNLLSTLGFRVFATFLEYKNSGFYTRLFGNDPTMPSYADARKNVSLIFCNSHGISEGPIRPNVPGVVEIGGIQIKEKPDALPQDIKEFLDNSKHGAILFSLGSNLKGDHVKQSTIQKIFKVLSGLKQNVIWKWDDLKNTPGKSANILYKKWMPQDDILAHPKIKLFITHAGKGGVAEAQYHAVPMLALPVFADQPGNADKLVRSGYGLRVDLLSLEPAEFKAALEEVLQNPSFAKKLQQFSKLYRDRPMTARESVIYWTNYVLRHHGAAHMQSPLVRMNAIESNNLDLYVLLGLALGIVIAINIALFKCVCRKCFGKRCAKKNAQKSKVKKN